MSLKTYKKKRKFNETPEPEGKLKKKSSKLIFVVQRHKASHLHYDFRLEMDGTLKSWAVPKGPSLNPKDKRLAMMVEDHPFSYRTFEGIIPEGNYGAGIVEIWDHGTLTDSDNSDTATAEKRLKAGLKAGNLKFRLNGKKLKGEFALVKLKGAQENAWLLLKHRDEFSIDEEYNSEEQTPKSSPINKWLAANKKDKLPKRNITGKIPSKKSAAKKKSLRFLPAKTEKLKHFIHPMLAKESVSAFSDKEWIYEIKWDGYRAIAEVNKKNVSLYSRNGNTFNQSYPVIAEALKKLNIKAILDGEIVALDKNGMPNFQFLQDYGNNLNPLVYYVFDLISLNGKDTTDLTLLERKSLLKKIIKKNDVIKYSDHIEEKGEEFFELAKSKKMEGIMAKKADSQYHPGARTREWLKIKHHQTQEAIIAGFTEPGGSRKYFGALILARKERNELHYIGHTGSGFDFKTLKEMYARLKPLIQEECPFKTPPKTNMPVTWVKPILVCEMKYTEVTKDGHLRHPIFLRLREDKNANEVTRESMDKVNREPKKNLNRKSEAELTFGKIKVPLTNLKKIFWPKEGITKGDVIDYYQSVSEYILPYLKDRPQSLFRTPNGIDKPGFFHKDAGGEAPDWVESKKIFSESNNKDINYILCNNKATLAYLNNLGSIEVNPWHSTIQALDKPDYVIIDLDPAPKNTFEQVIETALAVKEVLDRAGAAGYCKTSGATGLHIYIPMKKKYTYDQVKDFAHIICMMTNELLPEFTSLERNLKKRGNKMIYLDHLQNRKGQTIASVYSLRPKDGATVAMPLEWKELRKGLDPKEFNIYTALKRIEKKGDLFKEILGKGVDIAKCLNKLEP